MEGEKSMYKETTENVIYLAGGCFWGMEQLMQSIPGGYCHIPKAEMELFSKLHIDPGDSHLGHVSPMAQSPPTACVTASTVRLCALYRTRRCNPRATDISCTCLRNEFTKYNDIRSSVPIIMIRDAVVYAHVGLFKQDVQLAVQNQIGISKRVVVDQIIQL